MDISALKKDLIVGVRFDDDVVVKVRHINRAELRDIYKKATVSKFIDHKKRDEFDAAMADCLLGRAAIIDWDGFMDGSAPFPCSPDNIDYLMKNYTAFAKFINDTVSDLDCLLAAERDAERKNCGTTSSPG
jgi:hypothetical protein